MPYPVDTDWLIDHLAQAPAAEALLSELVADTSPVWMGGDGTGG